MEIGSQKCQPTDLRDPRPTQPHEPRDLGVVLGPAGAAARSGRKGLEDEEVDRKGSAHPTLLTEDSLAKPPEGGTPTLDDIEI